MKRATFLKMLCITPFAGFLVSKIIKKSRLPVFTSPYITDHKAWFLKPGDNPDFQYIQYHMDPKTWRGVKGTND